MKTKQYTVVLLMALMFATIGLQAQSARRSPAQEKKATQATRTHTKKATPSKARATQPARQVQQRQVQRQVQKPQVQKRQVQKRQVQRQSKVVQANRQVQKPQVQRHVQKPQVQKRQERTAQPTRQVQKPRATGQRTVQNSQRAVSVSNQKNPRSNYRKANTDVRVSHSRNSRVNKYSSERYYGGNHYHHFYPTHKVKLRYHHDTYIHNYHVLYYPSHGHIYWNRHMYRDYRRWYPEYQWRYKYGYHIQSISVFDAKYNMGEVALVYGRVYATWHNRDTDDFLLFFGGNYPHQQFTLVLPGKVARRFNWRPDRYFLGQHVTATGLITTFDGIPEIIVKNKRQVGIY